MNRRELFDVYRRTAFIVDTAEGITVIRDNERNVVVDQLLVEHSVSASAFVTAFNPGSTRLSDLENEQRHGCLIQHLKENGFKCLTGRGIGDMIGLLRRACSSSASAKTTQMLGRKFGQLAIVIVESGKPARVVEC